MVEPEQFPKKYIYFYNLMAKTKTPNMIKLKTKYKY